MKKLTRQQANTIFKARTRMLPVKNNYRNKYRNHTCRACGQPVETQKHVLEDCEVLHLVGEYKIYNQEIFSNNPNKLRTTAANIQNIIDQLNNIAETEVTTIPKQRKPNKPVQLAKKRAWAPLPPGEVHNDDDDCNRYPTTREQAATEETPVKAFCGFFEKHFQNLLCNVSIRKPLHYLSNSVSCFCLFVFEKCINLC